MTPLADYLHNLRDIASTGATVAETTYYGRLETLLNAVGDTLKLKVRCVLHPGSQGGSLPDGGLFAADQFVKGETDAETKIQRGQIPARGVIEVKGWKADVDATADTAQVAKYLERYGQVLVTNYRDFLLIARDPQGGEPVTRERFTLAASDAAFRALLANPAQADKTYGADFGEFLQCVLLSNAPLVAPQDVAWFLASYARQARSRIENSDLPALARVREALESSLGITFKEEKGDHFFKSTFLQALWYGVFSAWVLWAQKSHGGRERFDWRTSIFEIRVPVIQSLFQQVASPAQLEPLGLMELLDRTGDTLNRVDRAAFFERFAQDAAVQYFYEPFLEAFDPELRKTLGVWYTPRPIVRYQVARVDAVLKSELGIADGLADSRVVVLDPACGTGAYLVEVLRFIHESLGADSLAASDLKTAATTRLFGFEILPAPLIVAHLQLGLLLASLGAPLANVGGVQERMGVYLTNSLTGWEAGTHPNTRIVFPELEAERTAADRVKREEKILVILGNPPYNAFAGTSEAQEAGLVEPYKEGLAAKWGIRKFNLDDLYVRFFRLAERRIGTSLAGGVVCYISNFSYLGDPSFVVMRERFLRTFDALWFDSLNGDSRETGKTTPDGKPDPSVFSTEYNKAGIRVGTAVGLMVKRAAAKTNAATATVRFRQLWGAAKRAELLGSLKDDDFEAAYEVATPSEGNRFSFRPGGISSEAVRYRAWIKVSELSEIPPFNGPVERRGGALISISKEPLENRIQKYFDSSVSDAEIAAIYAPLMMTGNRIVGADARKKLLGSSSFDKSKIVRYPHKPFDTRWSYLDNIRPLFSEPSPDLLKQRFEGNAFFITRDNAANADEGVPLYFSPLVCDYDCLGGHARHFPLRLRKMVLSAATTGLFGNAIAETANLSPAARAYLQTLALPDPDADPETGNLLWYHALALGYAPAYLSENADGIKTDYPRIPLPASGDLLRASAALGKRVAALLDTETAVAGVTGRTGVSAALLAVASLSRTDGTPINPDRGDLRVSAGWGNATAGGVMPGRGRTMEREYAAGERAVLGETERLLLGETTRDLYLNDRVYLGNVPANVYAYTIGGYQVIKKWLSYREYGVLGRDLTPEEAREAQGILRRVAGLLLLAPALDASYRAVVAATRTGETDEG